MMENDNYCVILNIKLFVLVICYSSSFVKLGSINFMVISLFYWIWFFVIESIRKYNLLGCLFLIYWFKLI